MNHIGEEVVVLQSIIDVHLLVVDSQRARLDAAFLFKAFPLDNLPLTGKEVRLLSIGLNPTIPQKYKTTVVHPEMFKITKSRRCHGNPVQALRNFMNKPKL